MYTLHPSFQTPPNDRVIWRYMDFTKYVSMLDKRALFFPKATVLADAYEGAIPEPTAADIIEQWDEEMLPSIRRTVETTVVNSWHMNQYESEAMWKLYLKSDEGIAIKSTVGQLAECFHVSEREVYIGGVTYIDYQSDKIDLSPLNSLKFFVHKRRSFEYERELRAAAVCASLADTLPPLTIGRSFLDISVIGTESAKPPIDIKKGERITSSGLYIPVDLTTLIEKIYVSPTAAEWFNELVTSVTQKYGLANKEIVQSALAGKPLY